MWVKFYPMLPSHTQTHCQANTSAATAVRTLLPASTTDAQMLQLPEMRPATPPTASLPSLTSQ